VLNDNLSTFPEDKDKRRFSPNWYHHTLPNGAKVKRSWLIYSPKKNKMFCHHCWLFSDRTSSSYSPNWIEVNNFKKGLAKIVKHEQSVMHLNATSCFMTTKYRITKDETVISQLTSEEKKRVERNRDILKRHIDVVLYLGRQGLALRGHKECDGRDVNEGNFIELLKLLAKYDGLLNDHLNPQSANRFYLSSKIQNDFIESISKEITDTIANEMKGAKFFAIIADSTIDHTKVDEFSICLRYVLKNGQIAERFISFQQLEDSKSETMYHKILSTIQTLGLDIALCRGQAYDGASSMSGAVSGVQIRIKLDAPNAIYVHCYAHKLNLVLLNTVEAIPKPVCFLELYKTCTTSLQLVYLDCISSKTIKRSVHLSIHFL